MKKLLILTLVLIGCSRSPTQGEIDEAAAKQLSEKLSCALVAVNLNGTSQIDESEDGRFCKIDIDNQKIPYGFSFNEIKAIKRFLLIQQEQKLNEQNKAKKSK